MRAGNTEQSFNHQKQQPQGTVKIVSNDVCSTIMVQPFYEE